MLIKNNNFKCLKWISVLNERTDSSIAFLGLTLLFPLITLFINSTPAYAGIKDYFPITAGARWEYIVKTTNKPIMQIGTISRRVRSIKNGKYEIEQDVNFFGSAMKTKWTYVFKSNELLEHGVLRHKIQQEKLLLKSPIEKGKKWTYKDYTFIIKSTTSVVNTPDGIFKNCLHVLEFEKNILSQEYWYKKGIGWVKILSHPGAELLLKSYDVPSYAPPDIRLLSKKIILNSFGFNNTYTFTPLDVYGAGSTFSPSSRTIDVPVLLINFSDTTPLTTTTTNYFEQMLFSTISPAPLYPFSSLDLFYKDMSHGSLTVTGTVYGWFTATNSHNYYGNGMYGFGTPGADTLAREAIADACTAGVPFSNFGDQNGIRYVIIVHQGLGAEQTGDLNDIWSNTMMEPITCNGTTINGYMILPEQTAYPYFDRESISSTTFTGSVGPIDMGVFAHEFGHSLGLIDLYDINWQVDGAYGLGDFELMSYGAHGPYPTELSPWSRQLLGWLTPTTISSNECNVTLNPIELNGGAIKIHTQNMGPLEYYLISDSINTSFDRDLPGDGLLIWHVDDAITGNTYPWYPGHTTSHYQVAIVQADGTYDLEKGINLGDPQDYYTTGDVLSETSSPSSISYTGYNTNITIDNISFNNNGGADFNVILDPNNAMPFLSTGIPASFNVDAGSAFTFSLPVTGASPVSYTVTTGPPALTIDNNGIVHWLTTIKDKGTNPVGINISNCYGSTDVSFDINVLTSNTSKNGICALSAIYGNDNDLFKPLRDIRGDMMMTKIGRQLVHIYYYTLSPYIIKLALNSRINMDLIRYVLLPLFIFIGFTLYYLKFILLEFLFIRYYEILTKKHEKTAFTQLF